MMQKFSFLTLICLGIFLIASASAQNDQGNASGTHGTTQPVSFLVGSSFLLRCEQDEGSAVDWFKDNILIDTTNRNRSSFYNNAQTDNDGKHLVNVLMKDIVSHDDTGEYSCTPQDSSQQPYSAHVVVESLTGNSVTVNRTRQDVMLSCSGGEEGAHLMKWYRNGNEITTDDDKYIVFEGNYSLKINNAGEADFGPYVCEVYLGSGNQNATVFLNSVAHIHKFQKSKNIIEGDPLQLECRAYGFPIPNVTWYKDDMPLIEVEGTADRLTFKDYTNEDTDVTVSNATFRLTHLKDTDRADYKCVATNGLWGQDAEEVILVRVKGKFAALWPFLGICAEVAILCAIIFFYERRRAKKLEEEERREEADHLTNSHGHKGNDEVRQRK